MYRDYRTMIANDDPWCSAVVADVFSVMGGVEVMIKNDYVTEAYKCIENNITSIDREHGDSDDFFPDTALLYIPPTRRGTCICCMYVWFGAGKTCDYNEIKIELTAMIAVTTSTADAIVLCFYDCVRIILVSYGARFVQKSLAIFL